MKDNISIGNSILKFGDFFGSGLPDLAMAAVQYEHSKPHGRAHFETIIYTGVSVATLKGVFNRKRPNGGNHSMPSGHTSTSFASATYLASTYGLKWGIPAFSIATLVALERIKNDAHWLSDTIAGACLGIFWGRATYRHELNITPVVSRDTVGFNYQVRF
ncbi:MAG: phosphatase PAP2 family protein [Bdellovibrionaceae bacterium]|mgnify:CR=1 FL=1|nr:phosphatase PAP2 family protein [Pseudobdellovibrionaceae bacterium]